MRSVNFISQSPIPKQFFCLGIVLWLGFGQLVAQISLPVKRGKSELQAGMFYYDVEDAEDMRLRRYVYTLQPPGATCVSFDFEWKDGKDGADFVKVFAGTEVDGLPLATFGPAHKSGTILVEGGVATFEFVRDSASLYSSWSATWRSRKDGKCVDLRRPQECENVKDICGPIHREKWIYAGPGKRNESGDQGSCVLKENNSVWFRFEASQDGALSFVITPDNGFDDYDWSLWKGDPKKPYQCPLGATTPADRMACNFAAARGPLGSTGLDFRGDQLQVETEGNPFSKSFQAKKGDVYYLLVDCHSGKSQGFQIEFSEVVKQCGATPELEEIVRIAAPSNTPKMPIRPSDQLTRVTKVIRVDLGEKMNWPIGQCQIPQGIYQQHASVYSDKQCTKVRMPTNSSGLVMALLMAVKGARIPAYSAQNMGTPLHFGDILQAAYRINPTVLPEVVDSLSAPFGSPDQSWWEADMAVFAGFQNAFELLVDEVFDRNTGTRREFIRFIRIIWTDWEGTQPDCNMLVFRYEDVFPILDQLPVMLPHNDSGDLSMRDVLEGHLYNGILIGRPGKNIQTLQAGQFEANRNTEFQNFIWTP